MSPRKTRRGLKTEEMNDEKSFKESESAALAANTLNDSQLNRSRMRTRRQLQKNQSSNNDSAATIDVSLQLYESNQYIVARSTRGRKVDVAVAETGDESINITPGPKSLSKRTKKNNKKLQIIADDESVIYSDQDLLSSATKSGRRGRRNIKTKAKNVDNAENYERAATDSDDRNAPIIDIASSEEDKEVAAASIKLPKKPPNTPVRIIQLRNRNVESPSTVTPESSPITVTLTPHRTTKTPRKSPINIGSPKTHTQSPQKVSRTPRKLPIVLESPVLAAQPVVTSKSPRVISTKVKKSSFKSPPKSPQNKKIMTPTLNQSLRSPQLVLERISPSTHYNNLVTPVFSSSVKQISEEASMRRQKSTAKKKSPISGSGTPLRRIPTSEQQLNCKLLETKGNTPLHLVALTKSIEIISSTPRERIRRSLNLSLGLSMSPGLDNNNSSIAAATFYGTSPKVSSTRVGNESHSDIDDVTNALISDDYSNDSLDISGVQDVDKKPKRKKRRDNVVPAAVEISDDNDNCKKNDVVHDDVDKNDTYELAQPKTPALKRQKSNDTYELDEPKTPALRKKKNLHLNSSNSMSEKNSHADEIPQKRICRVRFASPPMNSPASNSSKSSTKSRSATPGSKLAQKRSVGYITKRSPIKALRPTLTDNSKVFSPTLRRGSPKKRRSNSASSIRIHSVLKQQSTKRSSSSADLRRDIKKSQVSVNSNNSSKIQISTNQAGNISQSATDRKVLFAKKVPNFSQMHQKQFQQMESLVDTRKRINEMHTAWKNKSASRTPKSNSTKPKAESPIIKSNSTKSKTESPTAKSASTKTKNQSPIPSDSKMKDNIDEKRNVIRNVVEDKSKNKNTVSQIKKITAKDITNGGIYNRFGYKVRKADATAIINQQISSQRRSQDRVEKQTQQRMALKGVRSNRRFEILMKMRNMRR